MDVRLLRPTDDRSGFDSGTPELDTFFRRYAGQDQFRHHLGVTYIACSGGAILGFVTLAAGHLAIENLPRTSQKKLPDDPLPILRLARLAVERSAQGRGVGKLLLRAVFQIAHNMADSIGCVGVVVDAKPDALSFYQRYGFEALDTLEGKLASRPEPQPLFLAIGSIPKAPASS